MSPDDIAMMTVASIYAVGIVLAAAGAFAAVGWTVIATKYLEGISRQPELLPVLRVQVFIVGGLMESFPFIIFAVAMWIAVANPFIAFALGTVGGAGH